MEFMGKDRMKDLVAGNLSLTLGSYASGVKNRLDIYSKTDISSKIWRKDPTIWVHDEKRAKETPELVNRLGWLTLPKEMKKEIPGIKEFADTIKKENYSDVVLLGMGGSSLAADVFMKTFGRKEGYPKLTLLDTTSPEQIKSVKDVLNLETTLFLVASKSGGTLETISLFRYFWAEVKNKKSDPQKNFVALTDPGSNLEKIADEKKFRRIFLTPKSVGGRYSALTHFGLVPAALIGVDVDKILESASKMMEKTHSTYPLPENPAVLLGSAIGELALTGKNKLVFFSSESLKSFAAWAEQLIAESTGKKAKGVLPVVDEVEGFPQTFGPDSVFTYIKLKGEEDSDIESEVEALIRSENPIIKIELDEKTDLGGEFFRWEMATAIIGAVFEINPFDQPNVESTKKKVKEAMQTFSSKGELPLISPVFSDDFFDVYSKEKISGNNIREITDNFLKPLAKGNYISLMAFIPRTEKHLKILEKIRSSIHKKHKNAITVGFGPRFLHSTGQLHKGDNNSGFFVQISGEPSYKLNVPEKDYSFGTLLKAQCMGDFEALCDAGRKVLSIHVKDDLNDGISKILKNI